MNDEPNGSRWISCVLIKFAAELILDSRICFGALGSMLLITYIGWTFAVENDSDKKAGFLGRGRLVILRDEKKTVNFMLTDY